MAEVRAALRKIVEQHEPVTCRQVFYLAVAAGVAPK